MSSDRSRRRDKLGDGYKEVVAQQGRVILDRDFNAVQSLTAERIAHDALDFVGPCGTPDDGFAISTLPTSPPEPMLWSPPAFPDPDVGERFDFLISPGTMFVGGERAFLPGRQAGHSISYSYFDQPDWIAPTQPDFLILRRLLRNPRELIYLELTEQTVSAVEDPELLDVALGGPDTTQRIKLLRRVKRLTVSATTCDAAWQEATALWLQRDGRRFDPDTMRLEPVARLQVGFTEALAQRDPCDPVATGGYFGVDNQLIRVQIDGTSQQPSLLWSYDNASFLYRVTSVSEDRTMLTLAKDPPDAFHIPQTGQLVEVLKTTAVLGREPDETDPTGQSVAYRVVAEPRGELRRLTQPFGPVASGDPTQFIVLDNPLPADYAVENGPPIFLRVWRAELPIDPAGGVVALDDPASGASTGVQVTISVPKGEPLSIGAFWELALRPATPQGVYPERLLVSPQQPEGPRQWVCPLAVIDWTAESGQQICDCRQQFESLVALTRRRAGCCTVSVSPADLAAGRSLQSLADRAAMAGKGSRLCLSPGTYNLDTPLRLSSQHAYLTVEACGPGAILQASNNANPANFTDGLVVVAESASVTLRGLELFPAIAPLPTAALDTLERILSGSLPQDEVTAILSRLRAVIAVRAANAADFTLADCQIELQADERTDIDILGIGLFLQGDCARLNVQGCSFNSGIGLTFNPIQTNQAAAPAQPRLVREFLAMNIGSPPDAVDILTQPIDRLQLGLASIADRVSAAAAAAVQAQVVVTTGITASPFLADRQIRSGALTQGIAGAGQATGILPCGIGDARIQGCSFRGLTFATEIAAGFGILRGQDNHVAGCLSGLWFAVPNAIQPQEPDARRRYLQFANNLGLFEEFLIAGAVVFYPPPHEVTQSSAAPQNPGPSSLFLVANDIEALPQAAGIPNGSLALYVQGNRQRLENADNSVSLLMSSNQLRSHSGPSVPTAFIVLQDDERCAITGNLVMNEGRPGSIEGGGTSLWLVPNSIDKGVHLLSVTGNVMLGPSHLQDLRRGGQQETWALYNANPF